MECQFENCYYSNHRMLAEFFRKYTVGPRPVTTLITVAVFLFFVIRSFLWGILWEMLPTLLFIAVIFSLLQFLPNLYAWSSRRQGKKQNDGILPETHITFGDTIEMYEGMIHITVEYRKILRVVRLKHSYVLMIGKRNGVMLDPNGFTKGTFSEFKQFLREKCPEIKIPE